MIRWLLLAAALAPALAGCAQRPKPPASAPRYTIGASYEVGGVWRYPREDFGYDRTGLAELLPKRNALTADGEAAEDEALAAAHPTLQLPAIARVINLENGRQIRVRINDRGPAGPGRILGLTRRAAELLGMPATGATRVRVQVESGPSQALRDQLGGGPAGVIAAPRGAVAAESLAPPPGAGQSSRGRVAAVTPAASISPAGGDPVEALPPVFEQGLPAPGQLWVDAGHFGQASYANQVKAKLYGLPAQVERLPGRGAPSFRVLAGPFASAPAAEAALDQARRAGVTDADIVVE